MSWNPNQGQDPNQPNPNPYGGYGQPGQPAQPNPEPYSGYGQPGQPGYQAPDYNQQQQAYGQPPYGQQQVPYGQQAPYGATSNDPNGPTSMGMSANVAAGLSYIFSFVTGLIFFFVEKQNRFVRFHAMQSIILGGAYLVLYIAMAVIGAIGIPVISFLVGVCLSGIAGLLFLVVSIICLVNAIQGKYFKLPLIGDYAERYANTINI